MKKMSVFSLIVLTAFSCVIQQPNGPKVSEESLKHDVNTLCLFATVEPVRALEIIIELGEKAVNNEELDIGHYSHPSADQWQLLAQWWEGGPDRQWLEKATSPIRFTKRDDESWAIDYRGDGMEYSYFETISFMTVAVPIDGGWQLATTGIITDTEGYEMTFGTDDMALASKHIENNHYTEWRFSINGNYSLAVTRNGVIVNQTSAIADGEEFSQYFYSDYLHYSVSRFYTTTE